MGLPVVLHDAHGPVAVHGLPYLDPHAVADPWGLTERSHAAALGEAMRRVRADLAGRPGTRSVVLAHAFVAGARPSESERDISVGGVARVPTSTFDGVDYVALGHLHGAHELTERLRYSGSPLAYSFSEATHRKGSWLVDLAADGTVEAAFVDAPVPRPLARLSGTLDALLTDPRHAVHEAAWVEVTLTDAARPQQAMDRLRRRFPHALALGFAAATPVFGAAPAALAGGRSDRDLALDFVATLRGSDASGDEQRLLDRALDACCGAAEAHESASGGRG